MIWTLLVFSAGCFSGISVGAFTVGALYVYKPAVLMPLRAFRRQP